MERERQYLNLLDINIIVLCVGDPNIIESIVFDWFTWEWSKFCLSDFSFWEQEITDGGFYGNKKCLAMLDGTDNKENGTKKPTKMNKMGIYCI